MRERREIEGKLMGLSFTWFCKSFMTILCNGFGGQGEKKQSWSPIGSDSFWITTLSVVVTGSPYYGHWVS